MKFWITVITSSYLLACNAWADAPPNYLTYSDQLASSGQPTAAQLEILAQQGTERVISLAFSDEDGTPEHQDRLTVDLGMQFARLPISADRLTVGDFNAFSAVLASSPQNTLVHCRSNKRASVFVYLHRVIHDKVPEADARKDLEKVWQPSGTWASYINEVFAAYGVSPVSAQDDS